jgi:hypothetical protein
MGVTFRFTNELDEDVVIVLSSYPDSFTVVCTHNSKASFNGDMSGIVEVSLRKSNDASSEWWKGDIATTRNREEMFIINSSGLVHTNGTSIKEISPAVNSTQPETATAPTVRRNENLWKWLIFFMGMTLLIFL